jgi:hypothetical protein
MTEMKECPYCASAKLIEFDITGQFYWCSACMNEIRYAKNRIYVYDQHGRCIREESNGLV